MEPSFAQHTVELQPDCGTAQVSSIGDKRIAFEAFGEQPLAQGDRLLLLHLVDPSGEPALFRCFNDEGGPILIKAVGVQGEPAPFGFPEIKSERVKLLAAAQPDKA